MIKFLKSLMIFLSILIKRLGVEIFLRFGILISWLVYTCYKNIYFLIKGFSNHQLKEEGVPNLKKFFFGDDFINKDGFNFSFLPSLIKPKLWFKPLIDYYHLRSRFELFISILKNEDKKKIERLNKNIIKINNKNYNFILSQVRDNIIFKDKIKNKEELLLNLKINCSNYYYYLEVNKLFLYNEYFYFQNINFFYIVKIFTDIFFRNLKNISFFYFLFFFLHKKIHFFLSFIKWDLIVYVYNYLKKIFLSNFIIFSFNFDKLRNYMKFFFILFLKIFLFLLYFPYIFIYFFFFLFFFVPFFIYLCFKLPIGNGIFFKEIILKITNFLFFNSKHKTTRIEIVHLFEYLELNYFMSNLILAFNFIFEKTIGKFFYLLYSNDEPISYFKKFNFFNLENPLSKVPKNGVKKNHYSNFFDEKYFFYYPNYFFKNEGGRLLRLYRFIFVLLLLLYTISILFFFYYFFLFIKLYYILIFILIIIVCFFFSYFFRNIILLYFKFLFYSIYIFNPTKEITIIKRVFLNNQLHVYLLLFFDLLYSFLKNFFIFVHKKKKRKNNKKKKRRNFIYLIKDKQVFFKLIVSYYKWWIFKLKTSYLYNIYNTYNSLYLKNFYLYIVNSIIIINIFVYLIKLFFFIKNFLVNFIIINLGFFIRNILNFLLIICKYLFFFLFYFSFKIFYLIYNFFFYIIIFMFLLFYGLFFKFIIFSLKNEFIQLYLKKIKGFFNILGIIFTTFYNKNMNKFFFNNALKLEKNSFIEKIYERFLFTRDEIVDIPFHNFFTNKYYQLFNKYNEFKKILILKGLHKTYEQHRITEEEFNKLYKDTIQNENDKKNLENFVVRKTLEISINLEIITYQQIKMIIEKNDIFFINLLVKKKLIKKNEKGDFIISSKIKPVKFKKGKPDLLKNKKFLIFNFSFIQRKKAINALKKSKLFKDIENQHKLKKEIPNLLSNKDFKDVYFKEFIYLRFILRRRMQSLVGMRDKWIKRWLFNYQLNLDIVKFLNEKNFLISQMKNNIPRLNSLKLQFFIEKLLFKNFLYNKFSYFFIFSLISFFFLLFFLLFFFFNNFFISLLFSYIILINILHLIYFLVYQRFNFLLKNYHTLLLLNFFKPYKINYNINIKNFLIFLVKFNFFKTNKKFLFNLFINMKIEQKKIYIIYKRNFFYILLLFIVTFFYYLVMLLLYFFLINKTYFLFCFFFESFIYKDFFFFVLYSLFFIYLNKKISLIFSLLSLKYSFLSEITFINIIDIIALKKIKNNKLLNLEKIKKSNDFFCEQNLYNPIIDKKQLLEEFKIVNTTSLLENKLKQKVYKV